MEHTVHKTQKSKRTTKMKGKYTYNVCVYISKYIYIEKPLGLFTNGLTR